MLEVLSVKRRQEIFPYDEKKLLLLLLQRALNITIPTHTMVLLTKAIKN